MDAVGGFLLIKPTPILLAWKTVWGKPSNPAPWGPRKLRGPGTQGPREPEAQRPRDPESLGLSNAGWIPGSLDPWIPGLWIHWPRFPETLCTWVLSRNNILSIVLFVMKLVNIALSASSLALWGTRAQTSSITIDLISCCYLAVSPVNMEKWLLVKTWCSCVCFNSVDIHQHTLW